MTSRTAWILSAALCLTASPAFAQLDTGTISGRITDSSGAVVANAQVKVVNTATNFENDTISNAEGYYRVPSLRPGAYRVTVSVSGFKQHVREGLDLGVGENLDIDVALQVGGMTESVHVTGEAPQLQTETSSGGALLQGTYLQALPLYQRNVKATFYLLPGRRHSGLRVFGQPAGLPHQWTEGQ